MGSNCSSVSNKVRAEEIDCVHYFMKYHGFSIARSTAGQHTRTKLNVHRPRPEEWKLLCRPDVSSEHYQSMFYNLNEMRHSGLLTDVEIKNGNSIYLCHLLVLCSRSSFFRNKVSTAFQQITGDVTSEEIITFEESEMKPDVLEDLLNFIYLGKISIPKSRLPEYVQAAKKWDLEYVCSCEKVRLSQYERIPRDSVILKDVFSVADLESSVLYIEELDFEESVRTILTLCCPLLMSQRADDNFIPPFNYAVGLENGFRIKCHRELLVSCSEYFHAMLANSHFKECKQNEVFLRGTDATTLRAILEFFYSKVVSFTDENATAIASVAGWLCPNSEIFMKVQQHLIKRLSFETCLEMMHFSKTHHLDLLYDRSTSLAYANLESVSKSSTFLRLPKELLVSYLSSDKLVLDSEMEVFDAWLLWASEQFDAKVVYECLKQVVRFAILSAKEFKILINAIDACQNKFNFNPTTAFNDFRNICSERLKVAFRFPVEARMQRYQEHHRDERGFKQSIVLTSFARDSNPRQLTIFHVDEKVVYSEESHFLHVFLWYGSSVRTDCFDRFKQGGSFALAVFDNALYITGGCASAISLSKDISDKTLIFEPVGLGCWKLGTSLLTARYGHSMAVAGDSIYVLGGFDQKRNVVKSVERYRFSEKRWTQATSLLVDAHNQVCVSLGDKIYMFCMVSRSRSLYASMHCYCTKLHNWLPPVMLGFISVKNLTYFTSAIVKYEKIYVFAEELAGGDVFTKVSVYDPAAGSWFPDQLRIASCGTPFELDGEVLLCESLKERDTYRTRPFPLHVQVVELPRTPALVDDDRLSYKLASQDDTGDTRWFDAVHTMCRGYWLKHIAFLPLHSRRIQPQQNN